MLGLPPMKINQIKNIFPCPCVMRAVYGARAEKGEREVLACKERIHFLALVTLVGDEYDTILPVVLDDMGMVEIPQNNDDFLRMEYE